jgi:hypothetical protein
LKLEKLMSQGLDLDEGSNGLKEERTGVEQIWPGDVEYLWSIPE